MRTLVPFSATRPKTRLDAVLDADQRRDFAAVMLQDVLDALPVSADTVVVATEDVDVPVPVEVDERPLTAAVNARLEPPTAVVMADLALATPDAVARLYAPDADVVIAPGRGGGTNALVVRHDEFRVDYHGASVRDHRNHARSVGASLAEVDSFRLATDVDEPADLAEVLLHAEGSAPSWLRDRGFAVAARDGRVGVRDATGAFYR